MKHALLLLSCLLPLNAIADPAVIEDVQARATGEVWTFSATLRHAETGWEDYADGWRVLAPDGTVLGTRVLAHPHANEQPFTRSLGGVEIPSDLDTVMIEASTTAGGWEGAVYRFDVPR